MTRWLGLVGYSRAVEYESLLSKVKGSLHLDMIERKVPLESSKRSLGGSSLSCHKLRTPNDSFRGKMTNFVQTFSIVYAGKFRYLRTYNTFFFDQF